MKKLNYILSIVLITIFLTSCSDEDFNAEHFIPQEEEVIESRKSSDDCEKLFKELEAFIPDTEEEISFVERMSTKDKLDEEDVKEFFEVFDISMDSFLDYVKHFNSIDCEFNEENFYCKNSFSYCISQQFIGLSIYLDIYGSNDVVNSLDAIATFVTGTVQCGLFYLHCVVDYLQQ